MRINYVYSIDSRIVWLSDSIFQVPVLDDLCRVNQIENIDKDIHVDNCYNYTVKDFLRFSQNGVVYNPISEEQSEVWKIRKEKIKLFDQLCSTVNLVISSFFPPVSFDFDDQLKLVAQSLPGFSLLTTELQQKHSDFVQQLLVSKKEELKKRYLLFVQKIQETSSLDQLDRLREEIHFNRLNII